MANIIQLALRGLQFFWTLLIMALTGNMIASATGGNPSIVNYVMFVSIISMASLFYLILVSVKEDFAMHPMLPVAVDGINILFTVIGGIALAAYLGVGNCGNAAYVNFNSVTSGSYNNTKRCQEAQADTAFLWFLFAAYVGSLVYSLISGGGSGVTMRGGRGGIRRGGPSMSQV